MGSSETAGALPEPPADGDVDAELPQAARPAAIAAAMVNARIDLVTVADDSMTLRGLWSALAARFSALVEYIR